ncbi:hypothetical protein ACFFLZ_05285 [Photobacterium aphoticum]|uniref:hypothetical protein n=1 Tax=Photobacterium aphoticum TaxID=754436 RepID=UPI00069F83BE|nr:hypothetical protein [Photobacterium aphoticum]PSU58692.1 hypothetical protein C9I90_05570 [Photobacterium aphoticum]GHA32716.1 hypothetical protein GCM10007086_02390 [Photobacterium aphoticum]
MLSDEDVAFQRETYKWLLKYFGGKDFYTHTQLVLPTDAFFPSHIASPDEAVTTTFLQVRQHAGMGIWPCALVPQEADDDTHVGPCLLIQQAPHSPNGTYCRYEGKAYISFNPELANHPARIVATFAHELGHYLTDDLPEPPPGGWENWEFATDLTAVFLGFGIFSANTAFNFQQYANGESQGWRSQRSGYLSDVELLFALALFCQLKGIRPESVTTYIKPSLKSMFLKCHKQIVRTEGLIADIRSVSRVSQSHDKHPRFE